MNREQRLKNVTGAFRIHKNWHEKIRGQNVILVDDILTTGATLTGYAKALKHAGAKDAKVLTLMRVAQNMWFRLYQSWTKMSLQAAEVIWQRTSATEDHAETQRMVTEKFQVLPEVAMAVWADTMKQSLRMAMTGGKYSMMQAQLAALRPVAKRVKANKTRLRKHGS